LSVMPKVRAHVIISGLVQGVFFRAHTRRTAEENGVTGWVKNRFDGSVEAVLEGEKGDVEETLQWCRRGPSGAHVDKVNIDWEDFQGEFENFFIAY
jgi:acylphosphatase